MQNTALHVILCLTLTGCAVGFTEAPANEDHATVVFEKAYQTGDTSGNLVQGYIIYEDGNCNKIRNAANFTSLNGDSKTHRVSTSQPLVFISAINEKRRVSYEEGVAETCAYKAEFQPKNGKTYRIRNSGIGADCKLEVTDFETGTTIPDLKVEGAFTSDSPKAKKNYFGYPCDL